MSDSRSLYEQVILDHNKNPHNFKAMEHPDHQIDGYNPLCGDQFTVYLKINGDVIEDITFHGAGCAISKSSASLMTTQLKGKTIQEALALFHAFHAMITISTESGDGRHNDVSRELSGIFHVVSGGNDRFATGTVVDANVEGLDLYNTMLGAYGVTRRMGPADRAVQPVAGILR